MMRDDQDRVLSRKEEWDARTGAGTPLTPEGRLIVNALVSILFELERTGNDLFHMLERIEQKGGR